MATFDKPFIKGKNTFAINHVGGNTKTDNNLEYIKNQKKVIDSRKEKLPKDWEPPYNDMYLATPGLFGERFPPNRQGQNNQNPTQNRYDPYTDFLYKKGLTDRDNVTRYYTHYLNIDSSLRNKITTATVDKWISLDKDPFLFAHDTNRLFIKHPNHDFQINDKISVTGIKQIKRNLKIKLKTPDVSNQTTAFTILQFTKNSRYMTVNIPHRLIFDNDITVAQKYDITNLIVEIAGVKGFPGNAFIENIPINTINQKHQIVLINPDDPTSYSDNKFYIQLTKAYTGDSTGFLPDDYNFSITFYYIAGVPINKLNAEYPLDANNLQGYHLISDISKDGYYITLYKNATAIDPNSALTFTGGSDIYVAKITDVNNGDANANSYNVKLEETYANIITVGLISSEFPNTDKVIKNTPTTKQNNKLYWQNQDDGDTVYSIEISPGNYSSDNLTTEINNKIFGTTTRVSAADLGDPILQDSAYTNNNYIRLTINTNTDVVTFTSLKEALLVKPFIDVSPAIDTKGGDFVAAAVSYVITIQHKNHGLFVGDRILISGAISYFGIPVEILNQEHIISEVVDKDRYKIQVDHFNLSSTRVDTNGGSAVSIYVPNIFRLRFDYPDTIGTILGFRNVGNPIAITKYASTISNQDTYDQEPLTDEAGNALVLTNNSLQLAGDNYILLVCKQLKGIYTAGKVKNALAKILLNCAPGRVLFNSFVTAPIYFHNPIPALTELDFEFYSPDGELYNFNGLDHSFTLEIVQLAEIPKGTGITSNLGKIT